MVSNAAATFDVTQYVPPDIQADYATAKGYYDQFSQASGGVTLAAGGRIELSDQASQAIADGIVGTISVVAPYLGAAYAALMAVAPHAGAGPGVCVLDPPAGPLPSQLGAWRHFTSWSSVYGAYPRAPAGSFEAFANPALEYNWLLQQNCFSDKATAGPVLLAQLVSAWNGSHAGPSRLVTRKGLNPAGFGGEAPGYDPIANALEDTVLAQNQTSNQSFEQALSAMASAPTNVTLSFPVNAGGLLVKPLTLHFGPSSGVGLRPLPAAVPYATTSSSSTARAVATVAVVGALGVAYAAAAGARWVPARLRRVFR